MLKRYISKWMQAILGVQRTIKVKEYIKGLYRYPKKMIGRNLPLNSNSDTDILVFAAHPDDEILGLSATINRHQARGDKVTMVYVTDGSGRDGESWRRRREDSQCISEMRYKEGVQALSFINITQENVCCLGFPDGGTHRYLKEMANDISLLINKLKPERIYVHCIEGGHNDHDLVSLVTKSVCNKLKFSNIFEWAEYSPLYPLGTEEIRFLAPLKHHSATEDIIKFTDKERNQKREMLACHKSQDVEDIFMQGEIIRQANVKYLREELIAYSQVAKEEWSHLYDQFLMYMKNKKFNRKRQYTLLKPNRNAKKTVRRI